MLSCLPIVNRQIKFFSKFFLFRLTNAPNRIFAMMDHQDDATIIKAAAPELAKANVTLESTESRLSFLSQYKRAKLELIARSKSFADYEIVKDDQMPSKDTTLAAWLIKNQSKAIAANKTTFIDFRAPIEWEALLVSDDVM